MADGEAARGEAVWTGRGRRTAARRTRSVERQALATRQRVGAARSGSARWSMRCARGNARRERRRSGGARMARAARGAAPGARPARQPTGALRPARNHRGRRDAAARVVPRGAARRRRRRRASKPLAAAWAAARADRPLTASVARSSWRQRSARSRSARELTRRHAVDEADRGAVARVDATRAQGSRLRPQEEPEIESRD